MSLREDLIEIAKKEGFESVDSFIQSFVVDGRRTFMELKMYLERKYKRYYSWAWVYIYCSPFAPEYQVQKRERQVSPGGFQSTEAERQWDTLAVKCGYIDTNHMMSQGVDNVAALARAVGVKYSTFYSRFKKWEAGQNVG